MSYKVDIVSKITENISQFRQAEQKVAQVILDDLMFAASASITELAEKSQVSESTITRLAKALGCKNVRDLKFQLAQVSSVGERFISEVNIEPSGISGVYESIHKALKLNANLITQKMLDDCIALIGRANQVITFGVGGTSTLMAQEGQFRLFRLGIASTAYSDPVLMRMTAATIDKNDVVLCFSLGGYSPDVEESVQIAKKFGASIISITLADSPLARKSDVNLPILIRESDYIFKPSASRYVILAAVDVLMTELAVQYKRKSREKLRRLKQTLDDYREGNDKLPLGD
ncbi:MAG: MurR/RpiR family transcriptional regulator [Arenicella sp.]|nr:MurR/RpiR family transcriptional regulator [Arenicella sp.]